MDRWVEMDDWLVMKICELLLTTAEEQDLAAPSRPTTPANSPCMQNRDMRVCSGSSWDRSDSIWQRRRNQSRTSAPVSIVGNQLAAIIGKLGESFQELPMLRWKAYVPLSGRPHLGYRHTPFRDEDELPPADLVNNGSGSPVEFSNIDRPHVTYFLRFVAQADLDYADTQTDFRFIRSSPTVRPPLPLPLAVPIERPRSPRAGI